VIQCPNCERENPDTGKMCLYCGMPLTDDLRRVATRALDNTDFEEGQPRWGTARFSSRMNLVVNVRGSKKKFVFDADEVDELVIGRVDPDTGEEPHIPLDEFDALEKGVSRRHAAIVRRDGALNIMDMGTPNGTFLNGQRLVPNQARVLRDGDDIRLGHLVLHISFIR
jgi:hypothetical protein